MMQLKQLLLTANIARNICRSFVSTVDVKVKSINSIKIKSKDFLETSDDKVKVILLNGQQEEVDVKEVKSFNVHSTAKVFKVETSEPSKLSMILELPLESSPDVEIRVSTKGTNIHVENLQTKNIKIETENGSVWLKNIKSDAIKAKTTDGNISTKSLLLAKEIKLKSRSGEISIEKSQGDNLEVEGASINVDSCYSTNNKFTSTRQAILKNLHANSTIKSSGASFKLSGFSGTIHAQLHNDEVEIQLSELYGENHISSTNPAASVNLGLSDGIISESNFKVNSNCEIKNSIPELIVCHKSENAFQVKKKSSKNGSSLHVESNGKSFELSAMSWIDSLKLR